MDGTVLAGCSGPADDGSVVVRMTRLPEHPARIDDFPSQISQRRIEMRAEFSALRADMATAREMRALHQELIRRLELLQEAVTRAKRKPRKNQR